MKYQNPILPGMYPDPSVCCVEGTYYLVNSTFEYFPGVPVFKSCDLVNWIQIGNCLTRESQLQLGASPCSGGVFAPVIRYHKGCFYMITSCMSKYGLKNFFVTAEDPAGEWSDPTYLDFEGIDPSIYWEDGRTYVQYAGFGEIFQVEVEESSGQILKGPELLTRGCGGRDVEGPHIWKREGYYYLLLAEGGTREGHMVTLMRSRELWGPFEASPYNPVISNKDLPREPIQCVGHGDWITGPDGKDYLVTLGTRHVKHKTILGRETMLTPAYWTEDGWLRSLYGYMPIKWEGDLGSEQKPHTGFTLDMEREKMPLYIISPRTDNRDCYQFENHALAIRGNESSLCEGNCAFWGIRQSEFTFSLFARLKSCTLSDQSDEVGLAMLSSDDYHMSLFFAMRSQKLSVVLRKQTADLVTEQAKELKDTEDICLKITGDGERYQFFCQNELIGWTYMKHLAIECAGTPNTGVVGGIYAAGSGKAVVREFVYEV